LFGVERTAEWIGPFGWKNMMETLTAPRTRQPSPGTWIQLAETAGVSARAWFGTGQIHPFSSISSGDNDSLFESETKGDVWQDLGPVYRFRAVSERDLSRDLLAHIVRCGTGWRWGHTAKSSWCSSCGKPAALEATACPACPESEIVTATRNGWFIRPNRKSGTKT
ncbi:MAG: hypothetical protein ABIH23_09815, partial [bacterium]